MFTGVYQSNIKFWCWNTLWWWSHERFCLPVSHHCQHSSEERPIKVLTSLLWLLSALMLIAVFY